MLLDWSTAIPSYSIASYWSTAMSIRGEVASDKYA